MLTDKVKVKSGEVERFCSVIRRRWRRRHITLTMAEAGVPIHGVNDRVGVVFVLKLIPQAQRVSAHR